MYLKCVLNNSSVSKIILKKDFIVFTERNEFVTFYMPLWITKVQIIGESTLCSPRPPTLPPNNNHHYRPDLPATLACKCDFICNILCNINLAMFWELTIFVLQTPSSVLGVMH